MLTLRGGAPALAMFHPSGPKTASPSQVGIRRRDAAQEVLQGRLVLGVGDGPGEGDGADGGDLPGDEGGGGLGDGAGEGDALLDDVVLVVQGGAPGAERRQQEQEDRRQHHRRQHGGAVRATGPRASGQEAAPEPGPPRCAPARERAPGPAPGPRTQGVPGSRRPVARERQRATPEGVGTEGSPAPLTVAPSSLSTVDSASVTAGVSPGGRFRGLSLGGIRARWSVPQAPGRLAPGAPRRGPAGAIDRLPPRAVELPPG